MHKKLIVQAFEKAEKERRKRGDNTPSAIHLAEDISEYIYSVENFRLGERSFRDYKNKAKKIWNDSEDINISQLKIVEGLSKYLEFKNYMDFAVKNAPEIAFPSQESSISNSLNSIKKHDLVTKNSSFFKKYKAVVFISVFCVLTISVLFFTNKQRWMVWENDHYVEVAFDTKKYDLGKLKIYKQERIDDFKKIRSTCKIVFFDKNGAVKVWYGKNLKGKLELFSSLGLHPETGKTLKPITKYMIRKYICKEFN